MIQKRLEEIFRIADELTEMTGLPFTPDGFLVGSAGEWYGKQLFGIELHENPAEPLTDGLWKGHLVQIKATRKNKVILGGSTDKLLVLKINTDGSPKVIYNGSGERPWKFLVGQERIPSRQGISIQLNHLVELNKLVPDNERMTGFATTP